MSQQTWSLFPLKVAQGRSPGDPTLAARLIDASFESGFEIHYSHELKLDHGTMVPLSFLDPERSLPVVPLIVNCMTFPMPLPTRCYDLGLTLGAALERDERKVAVHVLDEFLDFVKTHRCLSGTVSEVGFARVSVLTPTRYSSCQQ